MKKEKMISELKYSWKNILLFAALFSIVPIVFKMAYLFLIPTGVIYSGSIVVEDIERGSDSMLIIHERKITHETNAVAYWELIRVDGNEKKVHFLNREAFIEKRGGDPLEIKLPIPSNLQQGDYYWSLDLTLLYPFGIEKHYRMVSNKFKIV